MIQGDFFTNFRKKGKERKWGLFDASSWFPSFNKGITSASFHAIGNEDDDSEQFMISVRGPRITGRLCLMTRILTLSLPGDLFDGIANMMFLISEQETGVKLNLSSSSG